jgi:hypothetical protein
MILAMENGTAVDCARRRGRGDERVIRLFEEAAVSSVTCYGEVETRRWMASLSPSKGGRTRLLISKGLLIFTNYQ